MGSNHDKNRGRKSCDTLLNKEIQFFKIVLPHCIDCILGTVGTRQLQNCHSETSTYRQRKCHCGNKTARAAMKLSQRQRNCQSSGETVTTARILPQRQRKCHSVNKTVTVVAKLPKISGKTVTAPTKLSQQQ